jgi:hypothetical protein
MTTLAKLQVMSIRNHRLWEASFRNVIFSQQEKRSNCIIFTGYEALNPKPLGGGVHLPVSFFLPPTSPPPCGRNATIKMPPEACQRWQIPCGYVCHAGFSLRAAVYEDSLGSA